MGRPKNYTVKRSESRCACGQKNRNAQALTPFERKGRKTPTHSAFIRHFKCLACGQEFTKTVDLRR